MSGRFVVLVLMFSSIAVAKPKHVKLRPSWGLSPSWDPTLEFSKYPCKGDVRKAVITEIDKHVFEQPVVLMKDDELLLKIGNDWVAPNDYSTEENGDRILDPLTGHWKLDDSTELHISILKHVKVIREGNEENTYFTKMVDMALSIVKYRDTPDYCYERWTGMAEVLK